MKKLLYATLFLTVLASCDIMVIEPRVDYRDRVVGYYDVEEYSNTYRDYVYYSIQITRNGSYGNDIYINNFYGADIRIRAYVDYNQITIPYQVVNGYEIEGVGSVNGGDISLDYSVKDLYQYSATDFCETWATRDY